MVGDHLAPVGSGEDGRAAAGRGDAAEGEEEEGGVEVVVVVEEAWSGG